MWFPYPINFHIRLCVQCASPVDESCVLSNGRAREDSADFKKRLRKELVNRDGHRSEKLSA